MDGSLLISASAETAAGNDPVVVDDPQTSKAHMVGINVVPERKAVAAVEPAYLGMAPAVAIPDCDHDTGLLMQTTFI